MEFDSDDETAPLEVPEPLPREEKAGPLMGACCHRLLLFQVSPGLARSGTPREAGCHKSSWNLTSFCLRLGKDI